MHVTVGLAGKNYAKNTPFGFSSLTRECTIFNQMFVRAARPLGLNFLIICATNYIENLKNRFDGKKFMIFQDSRYKYIDEIVVLDLSSKENRAEFFGIADDWNLTVVEEVLKKVVVWQPSDDE